MRSPFPGANPGFLNDGLRFRPVRHHAANDPVQAGGQAFDQLVEGFPLAFLGTAEQITVFGFYGVHVETRWKVSPGVVIVPPGSNRLQSRPHWPKL